MKPGSMTAASTAAECARCPRLRAWSQVVAGRHRRYRDEAYWARPVPGFGDSAARLLVVGLAPGAHGANRTGRPFTGDASGDMLYGALHRYGFSNQALSHNREDGLRLRDVFITNVVRCVPPADRPLAEEIARCGLHWEREWRALPRVRVVLALGQTAFQTVLRRHWQGGTGARPRFQHGAVYRIERDIQLVASYHCSQRNTRTGRLTPDMFDAVFQEIVALLACSRTAVGSTVSGNGP